MNAIEIRRYRRLQGWDYRRGAVLFVTLLNEKLVSLRVSREVRALVLAEPPDPSSCADFTEQRADCDIM